MLQIAEKRRDSNVKLGMRNVGWKNGSANVISRPEAVVQQIEKPSSGEKSHPRYIYFIVLNPTV